MLNNLITKMYRHEYYLAHKMQELANNKKWKDSHPEWQNDYPAKYRTTNRDIINKKSREKELTKRKLVLKHYSHGELCCSLCKINEFDVLVIDHINGGGNRERKNLKNVGGSRFYQWLMTNKYPEGYRVLCWNCNHLEHLKKINYRSPNA